MGEWRVVRFGDVTENFDPLRVPVRSGDRVQGTYPYYGASGIVDYVHDYIFDGEYLLIAEDGENLRTRKTPVAFMASGRFWVNNHAHVVRGNALASSRFLCYVLTGIDISGNLSGSTQPKLTQASLNDVRLRVPDRETQDSIVEVLGALDDKIALNERIAATARQLCRASMEALWVEGTVSSLTDREAVLADGWHRSTLGRVCADGGGAIQTGPFGSQLHASDYVESGIPSVMPQNIGDNEISEDGIARIARSDADRLSKYLLAEGDIVYSRRGDVKRRALVRQHEAGWLCGTGCLRVRVGTSTRPLFMSYYLGEPEIQDWVVQHAVGATMPNLNTSILGETPVVLPPAEVVDRVHERLAALDQSATHVTHENRTLADLRDTLLPQLITGNLRVKDATRVVEEAV
ncbi:restriction endonuclease subunit S [Streptomyces atroolivaceus]|uniref:restriction endonuclease subunit S n=1 Tax=Streptomyces atroolivaceus TaxID=66869 RepID=UPI0033DE8BBE